jgi:hypothetical protein
MPKIRKCVTADLGTVQGVAVHARNGGATPHAGLHVGCKFSYPFRPTDNLNLLFFLFQYL